MLDRFVEQGWQVAICHRGDAPDLPAGILAMEADISDPEQAQGVVDAALERFGSVQALANIAGGFAMAGLLEETPAELLRSQMAVNLETAFWMTRAVLPSMKAAAAGSIVYIGTAAATAPFPGGSAYILSKIALRGLMQIVNAEARTAGVRANELVVKIVDTPRNRAENPDADVSRWTTGAELAEVIEWLASDASAPLSGGSIPAYGRA